jgi:TonB family protein
MPSKTPFAGSTVYGPVDITIQVKINEHGRVTEVHTIGGSSSDATLTARAAAAAKQWMFEPAKLHDKNVPSDHTIIFQFRRVE